jgi:hypothetical protein
MDPALMARIQSRLGDASSLDEAMAFARQRIALSTRNKRSPGAGAGAELAAEIYDRLKSAPFRQIQQN